jgi:hypothetical protein
MSEQHQYSGYHAHIGDKIRVTDLMSPHASRTGTVIAESSLTPGVLKVHFDGDPGSLAKAEEVRRWQCIVI